MQMIRWPGSAGTMPESSKLSSFGSSSVTDQKICRQEDIDVAEKSRAMVVSGVQVAGIVSCGRVVRSESRYVSLSSILSKSAFIECVINGPDEAVRYTAQISLKQILFVLNNFYNYQTSEIYRN